MNFSSFPGSLLVNSDVVGLSAPVPTEDFFGVRRTVPLGAVEWPRELLRLGPPL